MTALHLWATDSAQAHGDLAALAVDITTGDGPGASGGTLIQIHGPGGTGKTHLLAALARSYARAGVRVVDVRTAPEPQDVAEDLALLVDDAHRLGEDATQRVSRLLGHPYVRAVVASRPAPRTWAQASLLEPPDVDTRTVLLGHVSRAVVAGWTAERIGGPVPASVVDTIMTATGGLPLLVVALLDLLADDRASARRGLPQPVAPTVKEHLLFSPELLECVRTGLSTVDEGCCTVLHALAAGTPLDPHLIADVLGQAVELTSQHIEQAWASGFLLGDGTIIPLASRALLSTAPPEATRALRRRLLALLIERGDRPVALARALAAGRVPDANAGRLLEQLGTEALGTDPHLAGELLHDAAETGIPLGSLAARRAQAAALAGSPDAALRWADAALQADHDTPRAAAVIATVLARRGLPGRSADLFRLAGDDSVGSLALVLLARGDRTAATSALEGTGSGSAPLRGPSLAGGAQMLTAQGILASLGPGSDDGDAALSLLTRAAALLEPVGRTALVPDTPAALAGLVALHLGDLAVAEGTLQRAIAAELGGRPARSRHLLLRGWADMLRGRLAGARTYVAEARSAAGGGLEPRDELWLQALEVGIARRGGDAPELVRAWSRARAALLLHPVDLFTLLPLGELVVAAARLGTEDQLAPQRAAATELLARLGNPPMWTAPLHWCGVQTAIIAGDPARLGPHATALLTAARTSRYAATLVRAGRSWLKVLSGDVEAAEVQSAAEGLAEVGLTWDGSRLAGQAAARATDPRARATLLQCARSLTDTQSAGEAPGEAAADGQLLNGSSAGALSEREREVARLVVEGRTYREIGGQLFISAKTVEHHVSRMRQRLGAGNRSELLARLRAELAEPA